MWKERWTTPTAKQNSIQSQEDEKLKEDEKKASGYSILEKSGHFCLRESEAEKNFIGEICK
jgi:hypothetical protein